MDQKLQQSTIRQTRSRTAKAAAEINLNVGGERHERNSVASSEEDFEASLIDVSRATEKECGGCSRQNDAELFMVECRNCQRWYHFSCAGVEKRTVRSQSFCCVGCVSRIAVRSITDRSMSSSSSRARRLALERLEEEKKLADKKFLAEEEYLAKKYDLLEQEVMSEGRSIRSGCSSTGRVFGWLFDQNIPAGGSNARGGGSPSGRAVDDGLMGDLACSSNVVVAPAPEGSTGAAGDSLPDVGGPDGNVDVRAHSTPTSVNKELLGVIEEEREEVQKDEGAGAVSKDQRPPKDQLGQKQLISPVDTRDLWNVLNETTPRVTNKGVIQKIPPGLFDTWREETEALREQRKQFKEQQKQAEQDYQQEISLQYQKEQELWGKLRERDEQLALQRRREADLQRQLQERERKEAERERKEAELRAQRKKELLEREAELAQQKAEITRLQQMNQKMKGDGQVPINIPKQVPPSVSKPPPVAPPPAVITIPSNDPEFDTDQDDQLSFVTPSFNSMYVSELSHTPSIIPPLHYVGTPPTGGYPKLASPSHSYSSQHPPLNLPTYSPQVVPPQGQPLVTNGDPSGIPFHYGPTRLQLAARHVVPKKLPSFTGKAEEWPMFISSYLNSTRLCGFSKAENMLRLQEALKGDAERQVSSLLLDPGNVDEVIWALQIRFGKPEQIVGKLIDQVLKMPSPRSGQSDQMVNFGLMVKNLCGHLRAMGMENHLANPTLLRDLVLKLPDAVKLNWALYREQLPVVNLSTFGDYMGMIAQAMSNLPTTSSSESKPTRTDRKEKGFLNVHDAVEETRESDEEESSRNTAKVDSQCLACGGGSHQVASCPTFKKLDFIGRWKEVRDKTLCCRCLTQHSRYPCKGRVCGIDGCLKRHHQLLHNIAAREDKEESSPQPCIE